MKNKNKNKIMKIFIIFKWIYNITKNNTTKEFHSIPRSRRLRVEMLEIKILR